MRLPSSPVQQHLATRGSLCNFVVFCSEMKSRKKLKKGEADQY